MIGRPDNMINTDLAACDNVPLSVEVFSSFSADALYGIPYTRGSDIHQEPGLPLFTCERDGPNSGSSNIHCHPDTASRLASGEFSVSDLCVMPDNKKAKVANALLYIREKMSLKEKELFADLFPLPQVESDSDKGEEIAFYPSKVASKDLSEEQHSSALVN